MKRKRTPIKQRESAIQKSILDYLAARNIFHFKNNTSGIYKQSTGSYIPSTSKGASDIIGCLKDGRFLAIEVKRPGGRLTELQKNFLDNVTDNGGLAFVAYSVDDVVEKLGGKLA